MPTHHFLDFLRRTRQDAGKDLATVLRDEDIVFDTHTEFLFLDIDARLDGHHHARLEGLGVIKRVVDIQADGVAEAVDEILAEGFAVQVFAMGVDVVVGDLVEPLAAPAAERNTGPGGGDGGVRGRENDPVDFLLPGRELAVNGQRARDVAGVAAVGDFCAFPASN